MLQLPQKGYIVFSEIDVIEFQYLFWTKVLFGKQAPIESKYLRKIKIEQALGNGAVRVGFFG